MKLSPYFCQTFRSCLLALSIALTGCLIAALPFGNQLESEAGLDSLFKLRGNTPPPDDVVIVSLDRASAIKLNIDDNSPWPRSLHAQLIDTLSNAGAALIVFNIVFDAPRDTAGDRQMADAMASAGNVILTNYIKRQDHQAVDASGKRQASIFTDEVVPTFTLFRNAALASSPFLLPRNTTHIREFWLFKRSAGEIPTLPTTAFLYYLISRQNGHLPTFSDEAGSRTTTPAQLLKQLEVQTEDHAIPQLTPKARAWLQLLHDNNALTLNHYGPPESFETISYARFFDPDFQDKLQLGNKIVFVGLSDDLHPEWHPGYFTVFSNQVGSSISSVELVATAFSNLLDDNAIRVPATSLQFLLLFLWGFFLFFLIRNSPVSTSLLLIFAAVATYLISALYLFELFYLWLPILIPVAIQAPLALLLHITFYSRNQKRNHDLLVLNVKKYFPPEVIKGFLDPTLKAASDQGSLVNGICMGIDIQDYTTLSETLSPSELTRFLDDYYTIVLEQIRKDGANAWDAAGDGFMVIWSNPDPDDPTIPSKVCRTALAIQEALNHYNLSSRYAMQARFGIHSGAVRIGNIGPPSSKVYRAVGDAVNTASRIEQLNKILGTQILVSESMQKALPEFCHRHLGTFELKGKTRNVAIYQPLSLIAEAPLAQTDLCLQFQEALSLFQSSQLPEAKARFKKIVNNYPEDGPSRYYLKRCSTVLQEEKHEDYKVFH